MTQPNTIDFSGKPFHFIGIGGIGMSALAFVLARRDLPVSGSDLRSTHITQRLQTVGARVFDRQEASNLSAFDRGLAPSQPQVICSTAIARTNHEYRAAVERGCPIYHRSDLLAALIRNYRSIAVAGTHGKTTTSSLAGYMLLQAGLDPTIVVGGEVEAWDGNARLGRSPFLVAEADESDGSLAKLAPEIGIVTNIELDHPDHFQSLEAVVDTFRTFAAKCRLVVGCIDCQTVSDCLPLDIAYSLHPQRGADYTVTDVEYRAGGTIATVWERGVPLGMLRLRLLGEHNLSNALAVVAVGRYLGLDFATIAGGLATFGGTKRRFEFRGQCNGITFIDDYAHHPSEIRATLSAARLRASRAAGDKRVVAIFQPHRYSRTEAFLDEFARAFGDADVVAIAEIYAAGEKQQTIAGADVAEAVRQFHPEVYHARDLNSLSRFLSQFLEPGDLALFLGAGNLNQIIPQTIAGLDRSEAA